MKKLNSKGFVLAETVIVTAFLMILFTMIYANYYPLIGEYEKREVYDDVDGKYAAYWIKKIIESNNYQITDEKKINLMNSLGYLRFECKNVTDDVEQQLCVDLVKSLEVANCDDDGNDCDIFITHFRIGTTGLSTISPNFKETVNSNTPVKHYQENCYTTSKTLTSVCEASYKNSYYTSCCTNRGYINLCKNINTDDPDILSSAQRSVMNYCKKRTTASVFSTAISDYINYLPDYSLLSETSSAKYRLIMVIQHKKDSNNYYSFSTMEVNK